MPLVFWGFSQGLARAQVVFRHSGDSEVEHPEGAVLLFDVMNMGAATELFVTVSGLQGGESFEVKSIAIAIEPGQSQVLLDPFLPDFKRFAKSLKEGRNTYCLELSNATSGVTIGRTCFNVTKTGKEKSDKQLFAFHGRTNVESRVSTNAYPNGQIPASYLTWQIFPSLVVYDIPFTGSLTLSTMNSSQLQSLNNYTIGFDPNAFRNKLLKRAKAKGEALYREKQAEFQEQFGFVNEYKHLSAVLENPEVLKELEQLERLESATKLQDSLSQLGDYPELKERLIAEGQERSKRELEERRRAFEKRKQEAEDKGLAFTEEFDDTPRYFDVAQEKADSLKAIQDSLKGLSPKKLGYQRMLDKKKTLDGKWEETGLDSLAEVDAMLDDPRKNIGSLAEPKKLQRFLKGEGLISKGETLLNAINKFSFGTVFPNLSDFTLAGIPVNGLDLEFSPGPLVFKFVHGESRRAVPIQDLSTASYRREVSGGSIGLSKESLGSLSVSYSGQRDDENSINPRDSLFAYYRKPVANKVASIHGELMLFKKRVRLKGEYSRSHYMPDIGETGAEHFNVLGGDSLPVSRNWVSEMLEQGNGADFFTGQAAKGELAVDFFKGRTKATGTFEHIGSGFRSLGVPFLLTGVDGFDLKLAQSLLKRKITVTLNGKYFWSNSDSTDLNAVDMGNQLALGAKIDVRFPKLPSFSVGYNPTIQSNDTVVFRMDAWNAQVSHQLKVGKSNLMLMGAGARQELTFPDPTRNMVNYNLSVSSNLVLENGLLFGASIGLIQMEFIDSTSRNHYYSVNGMFNYKKWTFSGNSMVFFGPQTSVRVSNRISASTKFFRKLRVEAVLEHNEIPQMMSWGAIYPRFTEFACLLRLGYQW